MNHICKICGKDNNEIKFLKKGTWVGTRRRPEEFFESREYDFGWDYYPKFDLRQISCECGYVWYEKV